MGLLNGNGRKAGRGDGLAVTLLLLIGDVISNALGDFGELGAEDFGGGGEDQIAARAGEDAAEHEEVAHVVEIGVGGDVVAEVDADGLVCLLYTSPSPRDGLLSRMPSSA